jgi:threonine dehydratase
MSATLPLPVDLTAVEKASDRLAPFLQATPLRNYETLDHALGLRVFVKHENHLPTNSFKVRNAVSVLTSLSAAERAGGIIAASRGNFGLGLAWAGKHLKIPVTICVPHGNNPEKNEAIRLYGAELIEAGTNFDAAGEAMQRIAAERGLHVIASANDAQVIAGAGTLTLEILQQARDMGETIDAVFYAVGGGSTAAGAVAVLQSLAPQIRAVGVQAELASAIHDSWRSGTIISTLCADTLADGIATRKPYAMTFEAMKAGLSDFVLVSETEIMAAMRQMIRATHNLVEGAGAVGLAGLMKTAATLRGKTAVVVLSGSNIDQTTLKRVMDAD